MSEGHFGTSAEVSQHFMKGPKCPTDTSVLMPNCLGSEMSRVRSVRTPRVSVSIAVYGYGFRVRDRVLYPFSAYQTLKHCQTLQYLDCVLTNVQSPKDRQTPQDLGCFDHCTHGMRSVRHSKTWTVFCTLYRASITSKIFATLFYGWCYFPSETDGNMRPKFAIFRLSQTEIYTSKSLFSV